MASRSLMVLASVLVACGVAAPPAWAGTDATKTTTAVMETALFGLDATAGAGGVVETSGAGFFGLDAEALDGLADTSDGGMFGLEASAVESDDTCGGAGQVPCMTWSWCAWTGLFGECWGGLVLRQPYSGCDSSRLNNWGLVCVACGGTGQPTCAIAPTCEPRHNAAGLCYKCGGSGEPVCWDAPQCDAGYRNVMGFCSYAGFSSEPGTNTTATRVTQPGTGPVRGIADVHTHQFSNLGFGGVVFWGAPFDWGGINEALPWCDYTWDFATTSYFNTPLPPVLTFGYEVHGPREFQWGGNPISVAMEEGMHNVGGTGPFDGWPHYTTVSHQQMYYKWVERAFLGGLRLTVVHAVSNEALCRISKRRAGWTCNDMESVDRQIQAAKDMEWAIDWMDNNQIDGSGWYRIAYSSAHAREIIRSGKLAVVLGIEVDTLFNCRPGMNCSREYLRGQLQHYYNLGVRHVYPIHQFDNDFGGAAIFRNTLNSGNYLVAGSHFQARDCSAEGYDFNITPDSLVEFISLLALGVPPANQAAYDAFAADCNAIGLTGAGRVLIEEMMDMKFIIDTDHMSRLMVDAVLDMAKAHTPNPYPLISGHTSFNGMGVGNEFSITDQQIADFKAIGGMITAPIPRTACGGTRNYPNTYRYAVERMKKSEDDPFAAVAFSTDMNGFGLATSPRFRSDCPPEDPASALQYPFTGLFGGSFQRQVTGSRTFDFNTQGLAHFGLIPDFVADLKRIGMTDAELDPLFNSAESYIRMWEAIDSADRVAPPTITADVQGTRGANGWYTSNATVTWQISGGAAASGCVNQVVSDDTGGLTLSCSASGEGGTSTSSVTIRRDATPPVLVSAEVLTPPNAEGWNNTNVQVRFAVSDAASGMPSGGATESVIVTLTNEGTNLQARHDFYDRAGNRFTAQFDGIRIDKTPPRLGLQFASLPPDATIAQQAAEQARWHNAPVRFRVSADDGPFGSGVADISAQELVLATEGLAVMGSITLTDRAGNVASVASDPVKIDLTPPVITFVSRAPLANTHGWNNVPVTGLWACSDALSGAAAPQAQATLSTEGGNQALTGTCADVAGNTASHDVPGVNIDWTPPVITAGALPVANAAGWNNTDVTLTFTATDALSGVDGAEIVPVVLSAEGTDLGDSRTFTDRAGNSATGSFGGIQIDKTPPTLAYTLQSPSANAAGWNNTDVAFGFTAADALSGLLSTSIPTPLVLSAEGAAVTGHVTATDVAGNSATFTSPAVRIDKTAPIVMCVASPDEIWPPNNQMRPVAVTLTFTDALSGTDAYELTSATSSEPGNHLSGFVPGSQALTGQVRAQRLGNGPGRTYALSYEGRDLAGNAASCTTEILVPHDRRR
ncbi:MAG: membrane dipeptidase [Vicinamibacterales bacterium]|nr:membrane dipeptidase [Vicinamibacterales bacterium]